MAEKKKLVNRLQRERSPLPPDFAFTGIIAGAAGGLVISWIMEVALERPQTVIMLVTGLVGLVLGVTVEIIRYAWRLWRWKAVQQRWAERRADKS